MFLISRRGRDVAEVEMIEDARDVVRSLPPGTYDVDGITAAESSVATIRAWGRRVEEDPWPTGT